MLLAIVWEMGINALAGYGARGNALAVPPSPAAVNLADADYLLKGKTTLPGARETDGGGSPETAPVAPVGEVLPLPPAERPDYPRAVPETGPTALPGAAPTALPAAGSDPAEQVAPPAIELAPGNRPINSFMAITMKEELVNLIGRFESAQLMADAVDQPTQLRLAQTDPVLTASLSSVIATAAGSPANQPRSQQALGEARQLLADWDGLMERQEYAIARARWQAVQQSLWQSLPTEHPYGQPEIRAVWLDRGTIVGARNRAGLAAIFDRLAAAGINTVFFETINAGYPIYPSEIAPAQNPLVRQWDPLAAAVELAHERHMQLHAWIWTFAAGNQRHNSLLNWPTDYPGPVLALHPGWGGADNQGNLVPPGQTKPFFDPANQELRGYLLRLISEIITHYPVDGIQLDYIRYPFQNPGAGRTYGYGQAARWQFQAATGVDPMDLSPRPDPQQPPEIQQRQQRLWDQWTDFRIHQVSSFVYVVSQMIERQRPEVILSTAVFALPEHERLQKIQQDWGTWAREGYVDWVVLMSYAEDTNRFEQLVTPWLLEPAFESTLIIPGVRLLNLSEAATLDQIQAARDLPASGYALFATADLGTGLETILGQTQGTLGDSSSQLPPQADPYGAALGRYQALQREWNWLLSHDQLWMDRQKLDQWIADANSLEQSLQTLAAHPSVRGLQTARQQLETVRTALQSQVLVETTSSRYRLESWQHRLTTIETLLAYGERQRHRGR